MNWRKVSGLLFVVVLVVSLMPTVSLAQAPLQSESTGDREMVEADQADVQPETPRQPACALLSDARVRKWMSGSLELKLRVLCGLVSPAEAHLAPSMASAPWQPSSPVQATDIQVTAPESGAADNTTQSETSIAVHGQTICAAYNDEGDYPGVSSFSGYSYSHDGGITWTDAGYIPPGPSDSSWGDPSVAYRAADNSFYYASLSDSGLSLWRSSDQCQTFSYVGPIHAGSGDDKELMAIDNTGGVYDGRIYVVWTDFNFGHIYSTYSTDAGGTWSTPVQLSFSAFNVQGAWPAVAPNGDVYVAWLQDIGGGNISIQIARSTDGGVSYTTLTPVVTGVPNPGHTAFCPSSGTRDVVNGDVRYLPSPQIAVGPNGRIHAVYSYRGAGSDEADVFYRYSDDNGNTWGPEHKLNDDSTTTDQFFPTLAVNSRNVVVASWYDRRNDPTNNLVFERWKAISYDGGNTWGPNILVSDVPSQVPPINPNFSPNIHDCYMGDYDWTAIDDSAVYLLWSDSRNIITTPGYPSGRPDPDVWFEKEIIVSDAGTLEGTVYVSGTLAPIVGANIKAVLITTPTIFFNATSQAGGLYSMMVSSGTYTVTASAYGYLPQTFTGIDVYSGMTTTQNFTLTTAPSYVISGTVTDGNTGWPLYASIDISGPGYPGATLWTDPVSGFYSITLVAGITYTFDVDAWVGGYESASRDIYVMADATEDFALSADLVACDAPGYSDTGGSCQPSPGGLVVGNVYDDNIGDPLVGASVENEDGYTATTEATPDDPDVDDAFYTLFSPAGSKTFTATMSGGYAPDVIAVTVVQSDTVGQDFVLPAGWLEYDPSILHVTVDMGVSTTIPTTLTNYGGENAAFELVEKGRGYQPSLARTLIQPAAQYAPDARQAPAQVGYSSPVYVHSPDVILIDEGFESGTVPPPDWDAVVTNAGYTWKPTTAAHSGSYAADVEYDPALVPQDEWLLSPEMFLSEGTLSFWSFGSVYWCRDTYDNCDLNVWIVVGPNVGDGDDIFVGTADDDWPASWAWAQTTFDLTPLLPGGPVRIGFQYEGVDGAQIALDDILLDGEEKQDVLWIAEDPVSGTVNAVDQQPINVTFDASVSEIAQPGDYYATLKVKHDTPYADIQIPVTMTVVAPNDWGKLNGTVTGLGYCDADPAALEGAQVLIEASNGMTWSLETDQNGYYQRWLDETYSPLTVTVTYPDHETGLAIGVMVTGQQTTTQDFDLRWLVPCLSVDPSNLSATLDMGMTETQQITLTNNGAQTATFEVQELDRGFQPALLASNPGPARPASPVPRISSKDDCAAYKNYAGAEPVGYAEFCMDEVELPAPSVSGLAPLAPTDTGYAQDIGYISDNFVTFALNDFPGQTVLGTTTNVYYGMDFDPSATTLYALNDTTGELGTIDLTDGTFTGLVPCPAPVDIWTGLTIDPATGVFYASDATSLYTIDPATGNTTLIGSFGTSTMIDIAINANGEMYGHDITTDSIYRIDTATGAATLIGATGYDASYAQGMDFDNDDGTLYIFLYQGGGANVFGTVDLTTGAVTPLATSNPQGEFEGAIQIPGSSDVPWLSEDPTSGNVTTNGGQTVVDVTFDAGAISQPGTYYATININSEDPVHGNIGIPVTMTVAPPNDWGKVTGVVSSLGRCDSTPYALKDAQVLVEGGSTITLTTDVSGTYSVWLAVGTYTLTATYADHITETTTVQVTAQQTTTQDFDLRWIGPCAQAPVPDSLDVNVLLGGQESAQIVLENAGAGELDFAFREIGQSSAVMNASAWSSGGPDNFGYTFKDSNEPDGPQYQWIDISATGTAVYLGDDDSDGPFPIGFSFNFYGTDQTEFYVGSNGFLSFGAGSTSLSNQCPLPNTSTPNNIISLMWDDLDPGDTNDPVYYETFSSCPYGGGACLVVQYENYHHYPGGGDIAGTFQAILFENGSILIQFEDAGAEEGTGSTTGIENADGSDGLDYACNTAALSDNLAICFAYPGEPGNCLSKDVPWLAEDPITGTVPADGVRTVDVTFTAFPTLTTWASYPVFTATLIIQTDDDLAGDNGKFYVPVTMTISAAPLCSFETNSPVAVGDTVVFTNTTIGDPPLSYRWDFGDGSTSTLISPTHVYTASNSYTVWLTATNSLGTDVCSATVEVEGPPQAGFVSSSPIYLGDLAYFTNTTIAWPPVSIWLWNFGTDATPATSSAGDPPPVTYASVGERVVSLTAVNSGGSDTYTNTVAVCSAPLTDASFSYTEAKAGEVITFTATYTPSGVLPAPTVEWSFGGTGITATHTFTPAGDYSVQVTVTNICDQVTHQETISVTGVMHNNVYLPLITKGQ